MLRWYPDPLLRTVLALTYAPLVFLAVLVVRAVCVAETPWQIGGLHGPGTSGHFPVLVLLLAIGLTTVALGWRGAGRLFRALLLVWHSGLTAAMALAAWGPDELHLHGEGVGLVVSLESIGPLFCLVVLAAAAFWVARDLRRGPSHRTVSPLHRGNKIAAVAAAGALIAAVISYGLDAPKTGLIATVVASLVAYRIVRPLDPSDALHRALVGEGSAPL